MQAFLEVDRADFVGDDNQSFAYINRPLSIGFGQTISQPLTVAFMLEQLSPQVGNRILDIGCGSGWTTALLSSIVGEKGRVVGIERIPELAEFAKNNLSKYSSFYHIYTIKCGNGTNGYKEEAPFDRIIAAASGSKIPKAWKEQLKVGGRIVAPVKDSIMVIDKLPHNQYREKVYRGFAFVPLIQG